MSPIYGYIPANSILNVHDYNGQNKVHTFQNVKFRTDISSLCDFQTPVGIIDSKVISITNKQLSFLPDQLGHFIGDEYARTFKHTYTCLINDIDLIGIEEPVFQFFDYESVSGTGHSYDLMFYLIYIYKQANLKCKLLVVNSTNTYYNTTLALIKKYYGVEYVCIDPGKAYLFKDFSCVQSYQNVLFHEVKAFINETLLTPILNHYNAKNAPYSKNVYKLKVSNPNNTDRLQSTHTISESVTAYFNEHAYTNLDTVDEEYRIYLLNKADTILISWGSAFYINIDYYILDSSTKQITIIFHPNIASEMGFLHVHGNELTHSMPSWATGRFRDQVYTTLRFKGKVLCMNTITHV